MGTNKEIFLLECRFEGECSLIFMNLVCKSISLQYVYHKDYNQYKVTRTINVTRSLELGNIGHLRGHLWRRGSHCSFVYVRTSRVAEDGEPRSDTKEKDLVAFKSILPLTCGPSSSSSNEGRLR